VCRRLAALHHNNVSLGDENAVELLLLFIILFITQHVQHDIIKYSKHKNTAYNAKHKLNIEIVLSNADQTASLIAFIAQYG